MSAAPPPRPPPAAADDFSLLIKPAGPDCNLRCDYCFYLPKASLFPKSAVHRMDAETLRLLVSGFMGIPMPRHVFAWQGGEPTLMGLEFFKAAVELQKRHGPPGAVISNGLQTNGTLLSKAMASFFAEYKFLLGVSVDGPPSLHDRHRRDAAGAATHARVLAGIRLLEDAGVEWNVLALVNADNAKEPDAVYEHVLGLGSRHVQFIPCVEPAPGGGAAPFSVSAEAWGRFLCRVFDLWLPSGARTVSIRLFDTIVAMLAFGERTCCSIQPDCRQYLVVEHNGDIYPCDFFVERALRLGSLREGGLRHAWRSKRLAEFGRRKAAWDSRCAACRHLPLCAGDCQKHRLPGLQAPSALCAGWMAFFDHALPGLRSLAATVRAECGLHPSLPSLAI